MNRWLRSSRIDFIVSLNYTNTALLVVAVPRSVPRYFIGCQQCAVLASVYDPEFAHSDGPICWPGVATDEDLSGMPPHAISVNELDPLRD